MLRTLAAGSVPAAGLDDVIREEYRQFGVAVDKIASDPAVSKEFLARIRSRLGRQESLKVADINWRLMTLRKRGEANGGLPRLERAYNGRTAPRKPR